MYDGGTMPLHILVQRHCPLVAYDGIVPSPCDVPSFGVASSSDGSGVWSACSPWAPSARVLLILGCARRPSFSGGDLARGILAGLK